MTKFSKIILAAAAALALTGSAFATDIGANTQGWANSDGGFNNSSLTSGAIANAYVGQETAYYNDFFTFALPTTHFATATLNIYNSAYSVSADPSAVLSFFKATDYSFAGLMSGAALATTPLSAIDPGHNAYVSITLNAAGIAALNAAQGQQFTFGGHIDADPACFDCTSAFGFTGGTPAAYLSFTTSAVPEPENVALLLAGLGFMGFAARRRQA